MSPRDERAAYFDAMNATIAQLHGIDPDAVGLGDYGRPGNYFERQIAPLVEAISRRRRTPGRDPDMDRLIEWLPANIPPGDETQHRPRRLPLRQHDLPSRPSRASLAVLDWELSTLGHPLADFAYHAMMYRMPPHIVAGLAGADLAALEHPERGGLCRGLLPRAPGATRIPDYDFYIAFNFFRLAAIFHGIKGRVIRGTAASAQARDAGGGPARTHGLACAQAA